MFRWIVLIACVLAAATGLTVGVMNPQIVELSLPGSGFSLALGSLLVIVFSIGVAAGGLIFLLLFHLPLRVRRQRGANSSGAAPGAQLTDRNA
jgi:uncharacterized membrane protein YciS (DUF1049 family)